MPKPKKRLVLANILPPPRPGNSWTSYLVLGLAAVALIYVWNRRPDPGGEIPVISMLEKVKDVEELELITFFSDEILVLGSSNQLQKSLNKAVEDSVKAHHNLEKAISKAGDIQIKLGKAEAQLSGDRSGIDSLAGRKDEALKALDSVNLSFHKFIALAEPMPTQERSRQFGAPLAAATARYLDLNKQDPKGHQARKQHRKDLQQAEGEVKKELLAVQQERQGEYQQRTREYQQAEKKLNTKSLEKQVARYRKEAADQAAEVVSAREALASTRKAAEAAWQLAKKQYQEEGLSGIDKPKLLAIVPTLQQVYLRLDQINMQVTSDSTVAIRIDSIYLAPVRADLAGAKHFDVSSGGAGTTSYQEVMEQILMNLDLVQRTARHRALQSGIMERACQQTRHYFNNLVTAFGYTAEISTRHCPEPPPARRADGSDPTDPEPDKL